MREPVKIAHPEWLDDAVNSMGSACDMDRKGILPKVLRGFMLETPAKRLLRCIHGRSNIRVGWAILIDGLQDWCRDRWFDIRVRLGVLWLSKDERESMSSAYSDEEPQP